jgi:hypothetical protein
VSLFILSTDIHVRVCFSGRWTVQSLQDFVEVESVEASEEIERNPSLLAPVSDGSFRNMDTCGQFVGINQFGHTFSLSVNWSILALVRRQNTICCVSVVH